MTDSSPATGLRSAKLRTGSGLICATHITDQALLNRLEQTEPQACEFCESTAASVTLDSITEAMNEAVYYLYQSADNAGVSYVTAEGGYVGADLHDRWDVAFEILEGAMDDDSLSDYVELFHNEIEDHLLVPHIWGDDAESMGWAWEQFVKDVRTSSRFVFFENASHSTKTPVARTASFLKELRRFLDPAYGLIYTVEPGTEFFRGRLTAFPELNYKTAEKLGPATPDIAAANRMSPAGIPMFYASAHPETAVKEIASHDVKKYANIGTFKNQKQLKVLDLTRPRKSISPFDIENREKNNLLKFLQDFAQNVSKPIIPDGRPHVEYVPTQIITELFRWAPGQDLDGIKLSSAQDGKDTFVFFYDAQYVADEGNTEIGDLPLPAPVFTLDLESVKIHEISRNVDVLPYKEPRRRHHTPNAQYL